MNKKQKELKLDTQKSEKRYKSNNYSSDNLCPIWIFDKLDKNGFFKFDIYSPFFDHKDFLSKMISYSAMTWADIKKQTHDKGKSKHHFLELDKLSKEAFERVAYFGYDKIYPSSIFSFAFSNTTRIIGIRIDEYFHVVWYDNNHQFCPSHLKHT